MKELVALSWQWPNHWTLLNLMNWNGGNKVLRVTLQILQICFRRACWSHSSCWFMGFELKLWNGFHPACFFTNKERLNWAVCCIELGYERNMYRCLLWDTHTVTDLRVIQFCRTKSGLIGLYSTYWLYLCPALLQGSHDLQEYYWRPSCERHCLLLWLANIPRFP